MWKQLGPRFRIKKVVEVIGVVLIIGGVLMGGGFWGRGEGGLVGMGGMSREMGVNRVQAASPAQANGLTVADQDINDLNADMLDRFNQVNNPELEGGTNLAKVVGWLVSFAYAMALIILTVMLVWGGIQVMSSGTTGKSTGAENGKKRIWAGVIGYLLVMSSFLIVKLIEALLKIDVPGI